MTVIGISSLNRENYSQPINLTAFKEAGSIEYGSDCLLGLQYEGMDYDDSENDKQREARVREILRANERASAGIKPVRLQLKVLKNRTGARGICAPLLYWPLYNYFEEEPYKMLAVDSPDDPFKGATSVKLKR